MLIICTICARGGSKGVPGKNIRPLAGKPLIAHTIAQARATGLFEWIAISSDSAEIRDTALAWGADMVIERPAELATDAAPKLPVIRHAAQSVEQKLGREFDILVDLDCTSPLRLPSDVVDAVKLLQDSGAEAVITGAPSRHSPYFTIVEEMPGGGISLAKPLPDGIFRRQDAPACYDMNASAYVWRREPFMTKPFLFGPTTRLLSMPPERSVDIDNPIDWAFVEFLMARSGPG